MPARIEAHGKRADLWLDSSYITIAYHRVGRADGGHHRIPLAHVTGIRWCPASALVPGFIQFTVAGAGADTTSVTFTRAQQPEFAALKAAVEQAIPTHHTNAA
jgi:hypothetical protein